MSSVFLRTNLQRFALNAAWQNGFQQPRCGLKLKSHGVDYYWRDYPYELGVKPHAFDRAHYRKNENARTVAVEGNIAVGKGKFAKNFADLCDLKYTGDVSDDDFFISRNFKPAIDYRDYNTILPKRFQFYTTEMLYSDPNPIKDGKPLYTQQSYYIYRYFNWWKSCAHIFHTGQGTVSKRSPFSTYIFAKALAECGRLSKEAEEWFIYYERNLSPTLFWPHLFVYLRSPVSLSQANLAKRNVAWESSIDEKFLTVVKQVYESEFLPRVQRHSEIFIIDAEDYDFDDSNDMQYLTEEICQMDLDQENRSRDLDEKLLQWRRAFYNHDSMQLHREHFSTAKQCMRYLRSVRLPEELTEGGLSQPEIVKLMSILNRDPRRTDWTEMNPWDVSSKMGLLLGSVEEPKYYYHATYNEDCMKSFVLDRISGQTCSNLGELNNNMRYKP